MNGIHERNELVTYPSSPQFRHNRPSLSCAARNLAAYRKEWGLPACSTATGADCVVKVN
jgi:hypothetical protein